MKKTTLFALAFLAAFSPIFGQTNWFEPSNKWVFHITLGWVGEGRELLWVAGDTAVGGEAFKKINRKAAFAIGGENVDQRLARQSGRKIFAIDWQGKELLLYDFDLATGDTVILQPAFGGQSAYGYVVTEVGTASVCGQSRATQTVKWMNGGTASPTTKGIFVEGVGCVEGLFFESGEWYNGSSYLFLDEPDGLAVDGERRIFCSFSATGCAFEGHGSPLCEALATAEPSAARVKIWPNPSFGELKIEASGGQRIEKAELFDALGRSIEMKKGAEAESFSTAWRGFGFLKIWTERGAAIERVLFLD